MMDDKVKAAMPLERAMAMYGVRDKERFQCCYEDAQRNRPNSTFYADFSVADVYGEDAIKDTYKRAFREWKGDAKMYTELVAALNHKIWEHYENGNVAFSELYHHLWERADMYGYNTFKGDDLQHFFRVLD